MSPPRRPSSEQDNFELVIDHAAVTDDATTKEFKTGTRPLRIDSVAYVNPTGLAQDASNYFNIKLLGGAVVLANWSTLTGAQGTIAADTFVAMVLNATASNLIVPAGSTLSLFLDETGAASLPAGKLIVRGRYL